MAKKKQRERKTYNQTSQQITSHFTEFKGHFLTTYWRMPFLHLLNKLNIYFKAPILTEEMCP